MEGFFLKDGKPLQDAPKWGMSLLAASSMRFRWNEVNPLRDAFFKRFGRTPVSVELVHSKTVYAVSKAEDVFLKKGDGIITQEPSLMPTVTVADCMPIFLYEPKTGVFGTLHSGWKGTGIVKEALLLAKETYGSKIEDFCVVMGPHIHKCCYAVDKARAEYFRNQFCPECLEKSEDGLFNLSLAQANRSLLLRLGLNEKNIAVRSECTCCDTRFGSFRRQTRGLPSSMSLEERQKHFTVQAAWVCF